MKVKNLRCCRESKIRTKEYAFHFSVYKIVQRDWEWEDISELNNK